MERSVLLVDPDAARQKRITQSLEGTNFQIAAAARDSEEGLRLAATVHPDVALIGTALGNGAGMHVSERLPKEYKVPVVLLASGSLEPPSMNLARHKGVMGFVVEPVQTAT